MKLSSASQRSLRDYLASKLDVAALYEFLIGAEYDAALSDRERDALAGVRDVALGVSAGSKSRADLENCIRSVLKMPTPSRTR
jgi:hypothetical protein